MHRKQRKRIISNWRGYKLFVERHFRTKMADFIMSSKQRGISEAVCAGGWIQTLPIRNRKCSESDSSHSLPPNRETPNSLLPSVHIYVNDLEYSLEHKEGRERGKMEGLVWLKAVSFYSHIPLTFGKNIVDFRVYQSCPNLFKNKNNKLLNWILNLPFPFNWFWMSVTLDQHSPVEIPVTMEICTVQYGSN